MNIFLHSVEHYIKLSKFVLATLSTSNHYRSKSSSLPPIGKGHMIPILPPNDTNKLSPSTIPYLRNSSAKSTKHERPQSAIVLGTFDPMTASTIIFNEPKKTTTGQDRKTAGSK